MPDYSNWNTVEVTYSLLCFILCSLPFPLACSVLPKRKTRELLERSGQKTKTVRTAGSCDRRGARTTPRLCPASPLATSPSAENRPQAFSFCAYYSLKAPARRCNVRFSGFLRVTRSAALRKPHKPPPRARRAVTGVLAVQSTCVFNKIDIFIIRLSAKGTDGVMKPEGCAFAVENCLLYCPRRCSAN